MCHFFFIHSSVDGHLGFFHVLTIVNTAAMKIVVHDAFSVCFLFLFVCLFLVCFLHLYWSIIALQWCVSFCFITKWISYTYTYIPISLLSCVSLPPTLPIPPLEVVTKHWADLPVLCGCFPLAIYFTFGSVYMSMPFSHFVPSPSLLLFSSLMCILNK